MGEHDFSFRVSDVYEVPRRGWVLRLKLLTGSASVKRLERGAALWLEPPDGEGRSMTIRDIAVTSGRVSQERFDRKRELDILVSAEDALGDPPVRIGWRATPERSRAAGRGSDRSGAPEHG